jgi:hypothetical protein
MDPGSGHSASLPFNPEAVSLQPGSSSRLTGFEQTTDFGERLSRGERRLLGTHTPRLSVGHRPIAVVTTSRHAWVMTQPICIAAALIQDEKGRVLLVRKRGTFAFMQGGKNRAG